MPISLKARLCLMMFLNYVIWGSWYVTIGTYLTATLKFTGTQAGAVFGTTALASMITPFFIGLIADRFFATEKVLAILHLIGAVMLYFVTRATSFGAVYALMLLYCLCYFPTIGLTNSLTLRQLTERRRRVSVHPHVRHDRLDRHRPDDRQHGHGNDGDAVPAGRRSLGCR